MKQVACVVLLLALLAPHAGHAQNHVDVARADGQTTPLLVFDPPQAPACAPLILLSHGAGGSEQRGLRYVGEALARDGWRAIAIGHRESGLEPLRKDISDAGFKQGLRDLVSDARAYRARFMDIDAALQWSEAKCHAPFKALAGHSMGAITVMLEAGARNKLGLKGHGGFDAYVALSPEGPGAVFPENAWQPIRAPMLLITGTRDRGLEGDYHWRERAFDGLPPGCSALAVIDGGSHMNFGGLDPGGRVTAKTARLVSAFLDARRERRCARLVAEDGVTLRAK